MKKTHSMLIHPGHHYAWDCFTNTIYYASDGLV